MIDKAINLLLNQEVVIFPTETVFALAADATSEKAITKIYKLKQRSENKPLSVFVKNKEELQKYAYIDKVSKKIIDKYMPGEITLILKSKNLYQDKIGFRIPNHEIALDILNKYPNPLVATSCNISNLKDATNYEEANNYFPDIYIINGKTTSNIPSTVIDATNNFEILRQGRISIDYSG